MAASPPSSIHKLFRKWGKVKKLGSGTYGTVYRYSSEKSKQTFTEKASPGASEGEDRAVKFQKRESDGGVASSTLREIAYLKVLSASHKNNYIVRLIDVGCTSDYVYYVMPAATCSLRNFLEDPPRRRVEEGETLSVLESVADQCNLGVGFCHANNIIHRDIKPDNFLVTIQGGKPAVVLSDFGLASQEASVRTFHSNAYSLYWRPPEVLMEEAYTLPADIWALGATLYQVFSKGELLIRGRSAEDQLDKTFEFFGYSKERTGKRETKWPKVEKHLAAFWGAKEAKRLVSILERYLRLEERQRLPSFELLGKPIFGRLQSPSQKSLRTSPRLEGLLPPLRTSPRLKNSEEKSPALACTEKLSKLDLVVENRWEGRTATLGTVMLLATAEERVSDGDLKALFLSVTLFDKLCSKEVPRTPLLDAFTCFSLSNIFYGLEDSPEMWNLDRPLFDEPRLHRVKSSGITFEMVKANHCSVLERLDYDVWSSTVVDFVVALSPNKKHRKEEYNVLIDACLFGCWPGQNSEVANNKVLAEAAILLVGSNERSKTFHAKSVTKALRALKTLYSHRKRNAWF